MQPSEILQFQMQVGEDPKPANYASELSTVQCILDLCEQPKPDPSPETLRGCGQITDWVAWQLGIFAEAAASNHQYPYAIEVAAAAMMAAHLSGSMPRIYANLVTGGNVLFRAKAFDEARHTYSAALQLPFPGGIAARASAHLGIGAIFRMEGKPRQAIHHYEHGMRYVRSRVDSKQREQFWKSMIGLYQEVQDGAGLRLCASELKLPSAEKMLIDSLNGSLDQAFTLRTRLLRQGNRPMADVVRLRWSEKKKLKEEK